MECVNACRPQSGRAAVTVAVSPHAEEDAVLLVGGRACLDVSVIDGDTRLASFQPGRDPLLHFAADGRVCIVGTEVAQLLRVVAEVEQHRPETLPPDILPTIGAHHDGAA